MKKVPRIPLPDPFDVVSSIAFAAVVYGVYLFSPRVAFLVGGVGIMLGSFALDYLRGDRTARSGRNR